MGHRGAFAGRSRAPSGTDCGPSFGRSRSALGTYVGRELPERATVQICVARLQTGTLARSATTGGIPLSRGREGAGAGRKAAVPPLPGCYGVARALPHSKGREEAYRQGSPATVCGVRTLRLHVGGGWRCVGGRNCYQFRSEEGEREGGLRGRCGRGSGSCPRRRQRCRSTNRSRRPRGWSTARRRPIVPRRSSPLSPSATRSLRSSA